MAHWYRSPDGSVLLNLGYVMSVVLTPGPESFSVRAHLSYGDYISVFVSKNRDDCQKVLDEIALVAGAALVARKL